MTAVLLIHRDDNEMGSGVSTDTNASALQSPVTRHVVPELGEKPDAFNKQLAVPILSYVSFVTHGFTLYEHALSCTWDNRVDLGLIEYRGARKTGGYFVRLNKSFIIK